MKWFKLLKKALMSKQIYPRWISNPRLFLLLHKGHSLLLPRHYLFHQFSPQEKISILEVRQTYRKKATGIGNPSLSDWQLIVEVIKL